jgi:hypothetical protein
MYTYIYLVNQVAKTSYSNSVVFILMNILPMLVHIDIGLLRMPIAMPYGCITMFVMMHTIHLHAVYSSNLRVLTAHRLYV